MQNYNQALELKENDPHIKDLESVYKDYFTYSIGHIKNIIISDPLSLKYTQALAIAYKCVGDKENFNIINNKLASLGGGKIESNVIPQLIEFNGEVKPTIAAAEPQTQTLSNDQRPLPFHASKTASTNGRRRTATRHWMSIAPV